MKQQSTLRQQRKEQQQELQKSRDTRHEKKEFLTSFDFCTLNLITMLLALLYYFDYKVCFRLIVALDLTCLRKASQTKIAFPSVVSLVFSVQRNISLIVEFCSQYM